ncbi:MAG: M1 family metallopeptidase [Bacteroidota bacterium]|nr:M1 family metallopeptidase [Bacteroidota bacterium]MDP4211476.1 M1 family metallopeptidase [Bacteroidota bacterium]MDP4249825.1 M1 family metallopeptidase [Bacteroidota bacterium]
MLIVQCIAVFCFAQPDRWQQRVKYFMDIDMNVVNNRFDGKQHLEYSNHSPDTLRKIFYHLYWNAFQPNSMMDNRSRVLGQTLINDNPDWDDRVRDRILHLTPAEIGYQRILSLKMNGVEQPFKVEETILEVTLTKPILPNSTVNLDMEFEAQVPLQIRRSGRDNPETQVRYSMSQWYPKLCEYDYAGWHPTPYVGREFYGVWGDFDVKIRIDKTYILGGTGYLQNPNQIGYGYESPGTKIIRPKGEKLTWHFYAPNVHDFVWAADPEFKHASKKIREGLTLHVLYKTNKTPEKKWLNILDQAALALPFIEKTFGPYPYKQYSFINGGDGGMEYPMATLLKDSGGWMHEFMHSWNQGMLGTNELKYPWMDEGFTQYAGARVWGYLNKDTSDDQIYKNEYNHYFSLAKSNLQEPLSTYADFYNTNMGYNLSVYYKGAVFMVQLGYIVGDQVLDRILLEYYREWRFKHPNADDFFRVAEKVSDLQLDWYKDFWINSIKTVDYGIDSLWEVNGKTRIRLRMIGKVPMPLDVLLQFKDGSREMAYIPQYLMFGSKPVEDKSIPRIVYEPWKWTSPDYEFEINHRLTDLKEIEIDPSHRMADLNRGNNRLELKW